MNKINDEFITTDSAKRATRKILSAVNDDGFLAIYGPIGVGKTILMRNVIGHLESLQGRYTVITPHDIGYRTLGIGGILRMMLKSLHEKPSRETYTMELQLKNLLRDHSEHKKIILAIDDAQDLDPDKTLRGLKKLREISWGSRMHLFSIILFGQPILKTLIDERPEIRYRINRIELKGFTKDEKEMLLKNYGIKLNSPVKAKFLKTCPDTPAGILNYYHELLEDAHDLKEKEITLNTFNHRLYQETEYWRKEFKMSQAKFARDVAKCDPATYLRFKRNEISEDRKSRIKEAVDKYLIDKGINSDEISAKGAM